MTDQERIESVKEDLQNGIKVWGIEISDIRWLVEKAERVNEVELQNSGLYGRICKLNKDNNNLWYENKRFKKHIERLEKELLFTQESLHQSLKGDTNA